MLDGGSGGRRRGAFLALGLGGLGVACGDRSPPALWPEPPPPTLAEPIGIEDPPAADPRAEPDATGTGPAAADTDADPTGGTDDDATDGGSGPEPDAPSPKAPASKRPQPR